MIRLLLALATVAVVIWVAATRWSTVWTDHPAYLLLLGVLLVVGVAVAARSRRERPAGTARRVGRVVAGLFLVLVLAAVAWLRPFPATEPVATADDDRVDVVDSLTTWELRPRGPVSPTGLVFLPGARVDPRAYLPLLRPIAAAGHVVVLVKAPFDLALLTSPTGAFEARPDVTSWVLGGHSLGGAAATFSATDPLVTGLLLWAAYPTDDLSDSGLAVLSVSGDRDGLATPADVDAARPLLPPDTRYVVVAGGTHAFFGDYGEQPGDGTAAVDRAVAQQQIIDASVQFLSGQ